MSWTDDALVSSARVISGNAGRYMSIDSGPIALTEPSTTMSRTVAARVRATGRCSATARVNARPGSAAGAPPRGRTQRSRRVVLDLPDPLDADEADAVRGQDADLEHGTRRQPPALEDAAAGLTVRRAERKERRTRREGAGAALALRRPAAQLDPAAARDARDRERAVTRDQLAPWSARRP